MLKEYRIALRNIGIVKTTNIDDYINRGGYEGFKKALTMEPGKVIDIIAKSGLRGRGGAGFPTASKWKFTRDASVHEKPGDPNSGRKYVVCNSDEGEPGTFKDRVIMEQDPHLFIEGIMIAAYAVGAAKAFIYIRGEYYLSIRRTRDALTAAKAKKLLGENIQGSGFSLDICVKLGGGSYLCGEEFALIESIEGKRGFPRIKPPYPAEHGVFGQPTVVNNVETLAHVPEILRRGPDRYRHIGIDGSPGTKIFTLCGDIEKPGYYEIEMGTPLKDILHDLGGGTKNKKKLLTVLCGGAAGTFIPPDQIDVSMDFDSLKKRGFLLGSGALIVLAGKRNLGDFLIDIIRFFHHESCGKCVPCRIGTKQLLDRARSLDSKAKKQDKRICLAELLELSELLYKTSLCPLGQSPYFPIKSAAEHLIEII